MPSWLKQTAAALVFFTLRLTRATFLFFFFFPVLVCSVAPTGIFQKWDLIMAIYYRQADTLSRAMAGRQAGRLQKDRIEMCARRRGCRRVWTHAHSGNKVPECSVYIIVFEMVMHEPVNQLAADKRAGPCPENTHTHTHTWLHMHTPTQYYTPPPM